MRRSLPLALLAACSGGSPSPDPAPTLGEEEVLDYRSPGPWLAGTETLAIVGTDGLELTVQVWFPARETDGARITYDGLLPGEALVGGSPDCAEARPLAAFSHGSGGIRYQSPFLVEHLATHGWVVVAPDHVGNTILDADPDFAALVRRRPVDVRDAVDGFLAEVATPSSRWSGCVAEAGYAVLGHSFGGYTALALGGAEVNDLETGARLDLSDPRVFGVVPLAPWDAFGALTDGTRAIAVPTLILTGARDETTPLAQVDGLWDPMTAEPRWYGVFPDGGHYSFSPVACALFDGDGCGADFLDLDLLGGLTREAALALLEGARGVEGAWEAYPEAVELELEARPPGSPGR